MQTPHCSWDDSDAALDLKRMANPNFGRLVSLCLMSRYMSSSTAERGVDFVKTS